MNRKNLIANAFLWAAAIIVSAATGASPVLTIVLLPALASVSLVVIGSSRCTSAPNHPDRALH